MPKQTLKKTKWTLSFDPLLKRMVIQQARQNGVYPVQYLEGIVREKFNPFSHTDVSNAAEYVKAIRKASRRKSDQVFLKEILAWQKSRS